MMKSEKMQTYSVRLKQERMKSNIYQMCLEKLHPWAHSAFPLRKHRFLQWMSLYSKTAFTSNFQTNTDEIWSNFQDSHLLNTTVICLLRGRFSIWFPGHLSTQHQFVSRAACLLISSRNWVGGLRKTCAFRGKTALCEQWWQNGMEDFNGIWCK